MKRNSTEIFIETLGAIVPLPWLNNSPDFRRFKQDDPTLAVLKAAWEAGKDSIEIIPDPAPFTPEPPQPNWEALRDRALGGDLYFVFANVRTASFAVSPDLAAIQVAGNISTAMGMVTDAILTVKVEPALAQGLALLKQFDYVFSPEEKEAWNRVTADLNFSPMVRI